jgi:hypothetical protein
MTATSHHHVLGPGADEPVIRTGIPQDAASQLKVCPYCSEEIQMTARRCKYCGFIIPTDVYATPSARAHVGGKGNVESTAVAWLAMLILWIFGLIAIQIIVSRRGRKGYGSD